MLNTSQEIADASSPHARRSFQHDDQDDGDQRLFCRRPPLSGWMIAALRGPIRPRTRRPGPWPRAMPGLRDCVGHEGFPW